MHTPAHNPNGYDNTSITDMTALQQTVRFLVIHGASDDNVHVQNTLVLVDKLDLAGVQNYDLHFYPDSDHSINFHNAHRMVYEREHPPRPFSKLRMQCTDIMVAMMMIGLSSWLVNAFNDEWHRIADPVPDDSIWEKVKRSLPMLVN